MIALSTLIILAVIAAVPLVWFVPSGRGIDAAAWLGLAVIAWISPPSAAWMGLATLLAPLGMRMAERLDWRAGFAALWVTVLGAAFLSAQLSTGLIWIGGTFFTLRQIHVIVDWWMGKLAVPTLAGNLRYQLFLPALFVGPVHRIQNFERQCTRRRWDQEQFFSGLERVLLGAFSAEVIGTVLIAKCRTGLETLLVEANPFLRDWALSACDWAALFFTFAGMTAVALGLAAMMGIKLEENFNQPWRARDLLDFWQRWHISLTSWVQDYVYRPVMALSRSPLAGLFAAMLVIGLWHEISFYYVLWSLWQSGGIVLNRLASPLFDQVLPASLRQGLAPLAILGWLSLARPVIERLLELAA